MPSLPPEAALRLAAHSPTISAHAFQTLVNRTFVPSSCMFRKPLRADCLQGAAGSRAVDAPVPRVQGTRAVSRRLALHNHRLSASETEGRRLRNDDEPWGKARSQLFITTPGWMTRSLPVAAYRTGLSETVTLPLSYRMGLPRTDFGLPYSSRRFSRRA
jgi:hypothetical protein